MPAAAVDQVHCNGVLWYLDREVSSGRMSRREARREVIALRRRVRDGDIEAMTSWETSHNFDPNREVPFQSWAGSRYDCEANIRTALALTYRVNVVRRSQPVDPRLPYYTGQRGRAEGAVAVLTQMGYRVRYRMLPDGERRVGRRYVVEVIPE